jgi:hypothetical protein
MRTYSFSSGDIGENGDKPVFAVSSSAPTTEKASGNTGDKSARREAGGFYKSALSPLPSARLGTGGNPVFIGPSPLSPVVPTKNR